VAKKPNILVVVGPTASGKSALAVKLAKKFNGEIISADSRQLYRGLDLGSGKITTKEMAGIPHHLLDISSPKKVFTVAQFQKIGQRKINEIVSRKHLPIICGGSAFYIQALVDSVIFPRVTPNKKLRKELASKNPEELCLILKKLDPRRLNSIDRKNPVRLIRAIEIASELGSVPKIVKGEPLYNPFFIGTELADTELQQKIKRRLKARIHQGMIKEVQDLHTHGVSWKRLESFGLEYRSVASFLQNKINRKEMIGELELHIWQFAKKQRSWFKKDARVQWFNPGSLSEIQKRVRTFLSH